jgi:POT family proton-dependent oligopeptide transporter
VKSNPGGSAQAPAPPPAGGTAAEVPFPTAFFGHPRGLATLFMTEFWERFSYYGMRSLLILFMTADAVQGGLGFNTRRAAALYGLYTAGVYLTSLPGGWIADRLVGQRRAVLIGGCFIAAGHFSMAISSLPTFYLGLALIVIGTGLLKPNASTMVGELYPNDHVRRDAGFSIFYMGINLGATVSPLVCGWLGQSVNWHLGFAAAGLGMVAGVVQYIRGGRYLGQAGLLPNAEADGGEGGRRRAATVLAVVAGALLLLLGLALAGVVPLTIEQVAGALTVLIVGMAVLYFGFQLLRGGLDRREIRRMWAIVAFFLFSALFWSGFEQAGSSLNLFADRLTDRNVFGWAMPASLLQAVQPAFIILFAPVFAWLWISLGRRNPSSPTKFALGLILMAASFVTMVVASLDCVGRARVGEVAAPHLVSPWWLVLTYLLQTFGELLVSPVGLSTVTKLAPHRKVSQLMGIWFMALSLGNLLAGQVAGRFEAFPLYQTFGMVALVTGAAGLLLLLLTPPIRALMSGVD